MVNDCVKTRQPEEAAAWDAAGKKNQKLSGDKYTFIRKLREGSCFGSLFYKDNASKVCTKSIIIKGVLIICDLKNMMKKDHIPLFAYYEFLRLVTVMLSGE